MYGTIEENLDAKFLDSLKEVVEALRNANWDLNKASQKMHVHKNTLAYRLNKIREVLNMDPVRNGNDRDWVNGFYQYLKRKESVYKL